MSAIVTLCNGNLIMVIKAQSPAGFAEEYIIESIWNNRFPPGSILPAERELSELIGVTRTTLREVLQRLARDGWLTIQHGKPTKVNNFWETSGLNILETLARLDHDSVPQLIDNLLSVRTNISTIFIRTAFRQHPDKALAVWTAPGRWRITPTPSPSLIIIFSVVWRSPPATRSTV